jgi:hypothetical protein
MVLGGRRRVLIRPSAVVLEKEFDGEAPGERDQKRGRQLFGSKGG